MKNVMSKAWEIAHRGQAKFGGKVSEYFVEALKLAWAIVKNNVQISLKTIAKTVEVVTTEGSRNHKSWVARIIGTHPRWNLDCEFVEEEEDDYRDKTFVLENGVYEVCDAGDREFIFVDNGEIKYVEYEDVIALVK